MFQLLNSYGAINIVEFSCTIKTKVFAKEANWWWHYQSKGILHTTAFWKIQREVSVVFLKSVSIYYTLWEIPLVQKGLMYISGGYCCIMGCDGCK